MATNASTSTAAKRRSSAQPQRSPQPVRLAEGGKAHLLVLVSISSPTGNSRDCPLIGAFHLIPPNTTGAVRVSISPSVDGRDCGSVNVGATATF